MLRRRSSRQALNLRRCGASLPEGPSRSHLHTAIDGTKVYCRPRWVKSHGTAKKRQEHAQMKRENQLSGGDLPEQATDQARPGHSDAQVPADWNGGARRAATEALVVRPRRLRRTAAIRRLVAETAIRPVELVLPLFVKEGIDEPQPVASMPGVVQHTRESLRKAAADAVAAGVGGLILFAIPAVKDERGSAADDAVGIAALALEDLSAEVGGDTVIMADLCLCEYTDHGHCGVLTPDGEVDNDATLERYAEIAVAQAAAGAHVIGPILFILLSAHVAVRWRSCKQTWSSSHLRRSILVWP